MDRMRKKFLLRVLSLMLAFGVAWHLGLTSVSYGGLTQDKNHIKAYEALADDTQVNKYPVKEELPGHKVLATNSNSPFWQSSNKTAVAEAEVVTLTEVPIPEMLTNTDEMVIVGEPEGGEILEANTGTSPDTPEAGTGTSLDPPEAETGVNPDTPEAETGTSPDTPEAILESESVNNIVPENVIDTEAVNTVITPETGVTVMALTANVNTFTDLKNAIAAGGDSVIVLTGNITADSGIVIPSDSNITLDMNGYSITTTKMLFSLNNPTSALTITDSRQGAETTQTVSGDNYGNHATTANASGKITLDYYVTKTTVTNSSTGATAETLEKHSVTSSAIISNSYTASIISVSAGTFNMTGGMLYGGKQAAISQTGGTSNLSGGYICGVDGGHYNISGAAVNQTGGTLNISGSAVLAGNTASIGGAVYSSTGTVNISGGIISGNTAEDDGGGVYLSNSSIATMSGGYITNNEAQGNSWYRGGGGVYVNDSAFTLNGGFITGNKAIGGGGISTSYNTSVIASSTTNEGRVYITGGFVTANVATANEGGGLCVRDGYYSEISGGHITNNITQTTDDWGGGGIFIGETGMVEIKSLLMTENTARYYGGGVGSCSTGNMYFFVEEGTAIYDNTAIGDEPIGNGAKPYDRSYTVGNTVFLNNGYQDVFSVNGSMITGTMLGGGSANWSGSKSDGPESPSSVIANTIPITIGKDEYNTAAYLMALTSAPTAEDIAKAQDAALVYINGNSSSTHGGGIMTNGNLILGKPENIYNPISLSLNGSKSLINSDGSPIDQSSYAFKFDLADENGVVLSTGTSDGNGAIMFAQKLTFAEEGTYTYIIKEQSIAAYAEITFDTKQYRITVTVGTNSSGNPVYGGTHAFNRKITTITVQESEDSGATWSTGVNIPVLTAADSVVTLSAATSNLDFTNTVAETTSLSVQKTWVDCAPASSIKVQLYANGEPYGDPVVITAEDEWFHLWPHLLKYDKAGNPIVYTVKEVPMKGYIGTVIEGTPPTETISTTTQNWTQTISFQDGATYLLVTNNGALANTSGDLLSWAANTSGDAANTPLTSQWIVTASNGGFKLTNKASGRVLTFVNNGAAWVVRAYASGDSTYAHDSVFTLVSSQLCSSPGGWYFDSLFNYALSSNAPIFTLYKLNLTTTTASVPVSDKHFNITNTANLAEYELPATGGRGTLLYQFVGLVLIACSSLSGIHWRGRQRRWSGL